MQRLLASAGVPLGSCDRRNGIWWVATAPAAIFFALDDRSHTASCSVSLNGVDSAP